MGSGKTSWAIQEMDKNPERSYIFVTPFLDEIERIKQSTKIDFCDPKHKGVGKLDNFHTLLTNGNNIAVTHKLFTMITNETRELIIRGKYTLIIDEALDVLEIYKELKDGDRKHLIKSNTISIDEDGYVIWNEELEYDDYTFDSTRRAAQNKCLVSYGGNLFIWQFPPDVFDICDNIYIMTYQFEGSLMSAYFQLHNIFYHKKQIQKTDNGFFLIDSNDKKDNNTSNLSNLINICEDDKLNEIGNKYSALSVNWFSRNRKSNFVNILKNNITNYLKNITKCHSEEIMWTTFSDYEDCLSDKGRKFTRQLTGDEQKRYNIQKRKQSKIDNDLLALKCFVPCNARATNMYSDRSVLVYAVNFFPNTNIIQYLNQKSISFNEDAYALNGIIQWVWRSRIRDGKTISVYIPSVRMRNLFKDWMSNLSPTP